MRKDYVHITLVCDESGSMFSSRDEVTSGVKKIIDEQKANKEGKVTISLYKFNDEVKEEFVGKDVNDEIDFVYDPNSMTAMNDGIGTAIDKTGKWLADMNEDDRPSKVMVFVFTDGLENCSKDYKLEQVKEMIKHQEEKYNWSFVYMGTDITTAKAADALGFSTKTFSSRKNLFRNYDIVNTALNCYRKCVASVDTSITSASETLASLLDEETSKNTTEYEAEIGQKIV